MAKKGILLINLGTPQSPEPADVGRYLKEFLLDPEVIDIPWVFRQLLVRGTIVPFRKHRSSEQYKLIWTADGSPLKLNTVALLEALREKNPQTVLDYGFRYGRPSLAQALTRMEAEGVTDLFVLPLYPQYATSATRTVETELDRLGLRDRFTRVQFIQSFHLQDFYIQSEVDLIRRHWLPDSHLLISFHSIPIRQIQKNHQGCDDCLKKPFCHREGDAQCYRRQCFETAEKIAEGLNLQRSDWTISFQSRLGRNEWLTPNTEKVLADLAGRGQTRLMVTVPGFVSDCLETLEEIDGRGREIFRHQGGEIYVRVPCLNADPGWVERLNQWLHHTFLEVPHGKTPTQSTLGSAPGHRP